MFAGISTRLTLLGIVWLVPLCVHPLRAASILDQVHDVTPISAGFFVGNEQTWAQMITVGVTGLLTRVDLPIANFGNPDNANDVILDIRPPAFTNDRPITDDAASLGKVTIPMASIPASGPTALADYFAVDVSSLGITVTNGQIIGLALVPLEGTRVRWYFSNDPVLYASGNPTSRNLISSGPDFGASLPTRDLGFRTWVDPASDSTSVPEPATGFLAMAGLVAIYFARRHRHS